jgi:PilZ domain
LARKVVLPRSVTFGRRPFRVPAKIPLVVGGGFRGTSTVLSNLHENGMFLVWDKELLPAPGERLDFVLPAHGCMIQDDVLGHCQVCWTRETPVDSNPRGFGVQFVDLPADSASRLTRLVNAIKTGILRI